MRSNIQPRSLALAVLVHLILVGFLWWGASWLQPQPTEVELWDAASLSAQAEQPVAVAVNETAPPVVKVEETVETADIETKVVKTVKPEQPDVKPAIEKKPVEVKPVPVKVLPSKPVADSNARTNILKNATNGTGNTVSNNTSGAGSADTAGYKAAVKRIVESRAGKLNGKSAVIAINVSQSGQVLGRKIVRSSGDSAWDNAALSAISRLPPNAPSALQNWNLQLTFGR